MRLTASIPTFAAFALTCLAAHADPSSSGWFDDESASAESAPEAEPAEAAPGEAAEEPAPAAAPAPASAESPAKATAAEDPVADRAVAPPRRSPGARRHDGFYLRLSLGGGTLGARGERYDQYGVRSDYDFRGNMLSGDVMVGGTPAAGLVLGGAYLGDYAATQRDREQSADGDAGMSFAIVGPFIDFFPDPTSGFHVGGMLGPAATFTHDDRYEERSAAVGFGGSVWVGYDFWISDNWSMGGMLRASGGRVETPDSRRLERELEDRDRLGVGSIALMVTALHH